MVDMHSHGGKLQEAPDGLKERAVQAFDDLNLRIQQASCKNDSLLSGSMGLTLYYFTLYEALGREEDLLKGQQLLEDVFGRINTGESTLMNPSFSRGLSGFLFVVNYISEKKLADIDIQEERKELEEYLCREALRLIENDYNDYLHGAFGVLFYFLQRLPDETVEDHTRHLINMTLERAIQTDDTFWLRNFLTSEDEKKEINLGLSHGQSGFLQILLQAFEHGIYPEKLYRAIKKGLAFILHTRQDIDFEEKKYSFFPRYIQEDTGEHIFSNRLAWCYGDLNQLLLLYKAGHAFNEEKYNRMANLMGGCSVLREDEEATLCRDSHFCHGAAGLAQVYRKLYLLSEFPPYANGYLKWIERTLDHLEKDLANDSYKNGETALLEGLPGIALTLLSFTNEKELQWGSALLL